MKISIDLQKNIQETEIVIKCAVFDNQVDEIIKTLSSQQPIVFSKGDTDYFFDKSNILFFETQCNKIYANTFNDSFIVKEKLYELEAKLPKYFLRVSKSTILNTNKIHSITRNLTAASLVEFEGTHKKVYVSRRYYNLLRQSMSLQKSQNLE